LDILTTNIYNEDARLKPFEVAPGMTVIFLWERAMPRDKKCLSLSGILRR
jgi:hypothetical protein